MKKQAFSISSLVLALLIMCNPIASAVTMTDQQAAAQGWEVFEAWHMLNYASYHYLMDDYVSPYQQWLDNLESDMEWSAALTAWRIATFDFHDEIETHMNEIAYYDAIIFNVLYDEKSQSLDTSNITALAQSVGDLEAKAKALGASTWQAVCKTEESWTIDTPVNPSDSNWVHNFVSRLDQIEEISGAMQTIANVEKCLGYCKTVLEAVEKIAKIEALLQNSEQTAEVFLDMYNRCPNQKLVLKASLHDYHAILAGKLTQEQIELLFAGEASLSTLAKDLAEVAWDMVMESLKTYGLTLILSQKLGKFGADTFVNSSDIAAGYYKLRAMREFETLVREETLACQRAFESSPNAAHAKKFIAAYSLMLKTALEGLTCTAEFYKEVNGKGLISAFTHSKNSEEYQRTLQEIQDIKTVYQYILDNEETDAYNYYIMLLGMMKGKRQTSAAEDMNAETLPVSDTDLSILINQMKSLDEKWGESVIEAMSFS